MEELEQIENQFKARFKEYDDKFVKGTTLFNYDGEKPIPDEDVKELIEAFVELYNHKKRNEIPSHYCTFSVYQKDYLARRINYLKSFEDARGIDFIRLERTRIITPMSDSTIASDSITMCECQFIESQCFEQNFIRSHFHIHQSIVQALERKREFLDDEHILDLQGRETEISTSSIQNESSISIFQSEEAKQWFIETLKDLRVLDSELNVVRGFQSKASAIFKNPDCKELIFIYDLQLKEFVEYMNTIFNANIKNSTNISSGLLHEGKIQEYINSYKKTKSNE